MKTQDELQIIIDEAKKDLSRETREAIDSVNWKLSILEMAGKYNQEQLDTLEMETELLLCGILGPDEYQKELENRMMLTKEQTNLLLEEMDKLIFKKIQNELEKILARQNIKIPEDKIITDYQLPITNKETIINEKKVEGDEVPKPPYAGIITDYQLPITNKDKIITDYRLPITNEKTTTPNENPVQEVKSDVFEDKLKGATVSNNTVSDYSKPKIDPYREPF